MKIIKYYICPTLYKVLVPIALTYPFVAIGCFAKPINCKHQIDKHLNITRIINTPCTLQVPIRGLAPPPPPETSVTDLEHCIGN